MVQAQNGFLGRVEVVGGKFELTQKSLVATDENGSQTACKHRTLNGSNTEHADSINECGMGVSMCLQFAENVGKRCSGATHLV